MNKKDKQPQFQIEDQSAKGLNGLDPEMSILSVNFATGENPYLNEHYQEDSKDSDSIK
jgi:hypothetical protein